MLEASQGHRWSGNLNIAFRADLFAVLAKSATLLRHDRFACLKLSESLLSNLNVGLDDRDLRHSHALSLHNAGFEGLIIDLLVKWGIVTTLGIDVMSQHVMPIVYATNSRFNISLAICVESRLAEVCRK